MAAPVFSPVAGTYSSSQTVSITSSTAGASIRYTTDGSTPTSTTGTLYNGTITISATTTVRALAYKEGMNDSAVATAAYTILTDEVLPAPVNLYADTWQIGSVYKFRVTGTTDENENIWGTGVYTSDSSLAAAATHAGQVRDGETKAVVVRILPGLTNYINSTRNGVTSIAWASYSKSFEFIELPGRNLLVNPGYEASTVGNPNGWTLNNALVTASSSTGSTWGLVTGGGRTGSNALVGSYSVWHTKKQTVDLTTHGLTAAMLANPDTQILFREWVVNRRNTTEDDEYYMLLTVKDDTDTEITSVEYGNQSSPLTLSGADWREMTLSFTNSASFSNIRYLEIESGVRDINPTAWAGHYGPSIDDSSLAVNLAAGTLLSLGKTAYSSSIEAAGFEADKAFDNDATTSRWASGGTGTGSNPKTFTTPQWIYVDLGNTFSISKIDLKFEAGSSDYYLQWSSDASNWTNIGGSRNTGNGQTASVTADLPVAARYIRMIANTTWGTGGVSLFDFKVYGN